eukprot:10381183-Alexandrium_andersonii.AAC.1
MLQRPRRENARLHEGLVGIGRHRNGSSKARPASCQGALGSSAHADPASSDAEDGLAPRVVGDGPVKQHLQGAAHR